MPRPAGGAEGGTQGGRAGAPKTIRRGVRAEDVRRLLLRLPDVVEGRSYGLPAFLLQERFFARFRDKQTVLVLQLATIFDRDVLMRMDARAFFFTEHYRDYPAVLIRLAEVPHRLLAGVLRDAWQHVAVLPPVRKRSSRSSKPRPR